VRPWIRWSVLAFVSAAVLVALRLGWLTWLGADAGPTRNILEGLSWLAGILALLLSIRNISRRRHAEPAAIADRDTPRSLNPLAGNALHIVDDQLPRVNEVSMLALRVQRAIDTFRDDGQDLPAYVSRDCDTDLEWAIAGGGLVVLHGQAAAGKSRAAAEAIRRLRPTDRILVPRDDQSLRILVDSKITLENIVVWLDDLERFLGPGGLDVDLLQRMRSKDLSVTAIVATIRDNELAAIRSGDAAVNRDALEVLNGVSHSRWITVGNSLSPDEAERARGTGESDPRIARALAADEGFGEYLAAGRQMMERWLVGDGPLFT
jgi:hypothetical protein